MWTRLRGDRRSSQIPAEPPHFTAAADELLQCSLGLVQSCRFRCQVVRVFGGTGSSISPSSLLSLSTVQMSGVLQELRCPVCLEVFKAPMNFPCDARPARHGRASERAGLSPAPSTTRSCDSCA
ncbi:hypothetical protein GN956_G22801 [Arapaima gigas]